MNIEPFYLVLNCVTFFRTFSFSQAYAILSIYVLYKICQSIKGLVRLDAGFTSFIYLLHKDLISPENQS